MFQKYSRCIALFILLALMTASFFLPSAEAAAPLKTGYYGDATFRSDPVTMPLMPKLQMYARQLVVEGGTRPYSVSMSNPILEIQPASNGFQYDVYAIKAGTTIITIKDSAGQTLTRTVTVIDPNTQPLVLGALPGPSDPVPVGQGRSFGVSGGKAPYTVVSANSGIARITGPTQAGIWLVTGVSAGTATITVTDAAGKKVQGTVHVGTTKPLYIQADATLLTGGRGELLIDSGNPPYTVTTSAHLLAVFKGNDSYGRPVYTLTAKSVGQGSVTVKDSKGLTATKAVTIRGAVTLSFPDLTGDLRTIDVGQTIRLIVTDGTPPYTVTADNPALATIQQQAAGQYAIAGRQAGVVRIIAKDKSGEIRDRSLTIRALPVLTLAAPDSLLIGTMGNLSLIGGASPFTFTVSGSALTLTKVDDKKYTLIPQAPGSATVTVKDGKGTTQQKTITVTAPTLTLTGDTSPLEIGYTRPFDIKGGFGSYTLTLSNANAKATLFQTTAAYTRYHITGVTAGTVTATAQDSQGKTAAVMLTIQPEKNPLKLMVSATTLQTSATGTLTIQGGTAPYMATMNNNVLTLTKVNETQYRITPQSSGVAVITVKDAKGTAAQQAITVTAPIFQFQFTSPADTPKLTLSAASLSIGASGAVTIQGGTAPYTVSASGNQLSLTKVNETQYSITAKAAGTVLITVKDAKGATAQQTMTVTMSAPPQQLKLNVPSNVLQLGAAGNAGRQTLTVQGGALPYRVTVSGPQIALRQVDAVRYELIPVSPGTVMVTVRDARGTEGSQTITVQLARPNPLTMQVSTFTTRRGQPVEIRLTGGVMPYRLMQQGSPPAQIRQIGSNVFQVVSIYAGDIYLQALDAQGQPAATKLTVIH